MIQVSQEKINQVEYLLSQSAQGNHVLFASDQVREAFQSPSEPMNEKEAERIGLLIEKLISFDSLEEQKNWLATLPESSLHSVIKTYINIVENKLFDDGIGRH
jgi:hypothetical protein